MKQSSNNYNHKDIESKWKKIWQKNKTFQVEIKKAKNPYFNLMMFPYPSAEGLHVGNMYAFTGSDIWGRYMSMKGNDVFEPIGLDGFGIHSENYALKVKKHPAEQAKISQRKFYSQLRQIGNMFSWDNKLETYDPDYYKWTQWIFIQLFKAGLAYRKKASVNFCPACKTVLADEQVIDGRCERCEAVVIEKKLEQWFFRITKYADRLLKNTYKIDWTEKVLIAQRNWIGKKQGIDLNYPIISRNEVKEENLGLEVVCFTTRPDTNFGATFVVVAPENPLLDKLSRFMSKDTIEKVNSYRKKAKEVSKQDRIAQGREKTGVFTGFYAINQLTNFKMPIWVSDFVIMDVGSGAVVGVPGHDIRDFEFAKKYGLEIKRVVVGLDGDKSKITKAKQVQEEEGYMINSGFLNGMDIHKATTKIMDYIEQKGWGKKTTVYKLRDWLISRQRYWGPPIPMINCKKCDWQSVKEKDLPVLLPEVKDWRPKGTGRGPLAQVKDWVKTKCPKCGGMAERETDVSDTFLDSAWYFLRYPSICKGRAFTKCKARPLHKIPWDSEITRRWLPVDMYIGGAEHSVLHLLYSRFLTMVFKDLGYLEFAEPYNKFRAHGLIIKDGAKMSKSKGNIVNPDKYIEKYGADCLRCYLMFLGPLSLGGDFRDTGIIGMNKFLARVYRLCQTRFKGSKVERFKGNEKQEKFWQHRTIKKVESGIKRLKYNTSIAALMEYVNYVLGERFVSKESLEILILLLAPFAPYLTEELWQKLQGNKSDQKDKFRNLNSIHKQAWPKLDEKYLKQDLVEIVVQVNGKVRDKIRIKNQESRIKNKVLRVAKKSSKIQKYIKGKTIKKEVFVKGKLLNFVV